MKSTGKAQKLLKVVVAGVTLSAILTSAALSFPTPGERWLTHNRGEGSATETTNYYNAIGAPATFAGWQAAYFNGTEDANANYYNSGDLGFGRDMNCQSSAAYLACYVDNHGFGPGTPSGPAVNDSIDNKNKLAAVAMVYERARDGQPNDVTFYIYDAAGNIKNTIGLDSDGPVKFVPQLCQACHGGTYDAATNSVSGASFLPFDLTAFEYSTRTGFTRAAQEPQFRELNRMVLDTKPNAPIVDLIQGWYGGPGLPGGTQNDNFVPSGYDGNEEDRALYRKVVKPYCHTCHVSQGFDLDIPAEVSGARDAVFNRYIMPHAERTAHNFWTSTAPAFLARNRGWSIIGVNRFNDPEPDPSFCLDPEIVDCSLRDVITIANNTSGRDIIVFDVDGKFTLERPGIDDDAFVGDLDITEDVTILGNGATQTIIDGGGIDRVFRIHPGVDVVIQGVTIQGGNTGVGGGIFNAGTKLTLNSSVVKNNTAFEGGGIENRSTLEINNSTISGNVANATGSLGGGGIENRNGTLNVNNSTISGNSTASYGGGIENEGTLAQLTVRHSTIANNTAAADGAGIDNFGGTASIENSIVAGNGGPDGPDCANDATFTSKGYNLVGQNGGPNGCPKVSTDLVLAGAIGTAINTTLQGSPPYHALVAGSPAIDAIPRGGVKCTPPSYDQRNVQRPRDGDTDSGRIAACDIGAFEVSVPPSPNLLRNASFELDANADSRPDNWSINSKFTRSNASAAVAGRFVGRFRATDNTGATIQQTVPVSAGKTYRFAGWTKIPATADTFTFSFRVQWVNSSGGVISTTTLQNYTDDTSGSWLKTTGNRLAPSGAVNARIQMVVSSLNGTIYVDHLEFRSV